MRSSGELQKLAAHSPPQPLWTHPSQDLQFMPALGGATTYVRTYVRTHRRTADCRVCQPAAPLTLRSEPRITKRYKYNKYTGLSVLDPCLFLKTGPYGPFQIGDKKRPGSKFTKRYEYTGLSVLDHDGSQTAGPGGRYPGSGGADSSGDGGGGRGGGDVGGGGGSPWSRGHQTDPGRTTE